MAYEPINRISSTLIPLVLDNVDTDQIIPARFLKATSRDADFGKKLFADWRYDKEGGKLPGFALNRYDNNSQILLAGENFGCGSSREHAAWALYDFGFRVVIAKSFADIFKSNALNNGLLVCQVPEDVHQSLAELVAEDREAIVDIDLGKQKLTYGVDNKEYKFEINPFRKQCLMEGSDLLDFLVARKDRIEEFEKLNLKN